MPCCMHDAISAAQQAWEGTLSTKKRLRHAGLQPPSARHTDHEARRCARPSDCGLALRVLCAESTASGGAHRSVHIVARASHDNCGLCSLPKSMGNEHTSLVECA